ncbi:ssDNA-binding domain-containing protein [Tenacibaculum dicentrarchi]|nr:ssDNA-binding domain-containing protein [Tenacibaculum dicentrarchi]
MITDKMIDLVEKSTGKGWQKKWGQKEYYEKDGFLIPINFVSKNPYRGVNTFMLKEDLFSVFENPYFMTFKQIKEQKGKLKKGSKGTPIVYFTLLYKFENPKTNKEFKTYDKERMINHIVKLGFPITKFDDIVQSIPIFKYYNVFNGSDIENIDFKLDELKLGRVLKSDESLANEKNEIAELIVKNYPKIAPTISHDGGDRAFYSPSSDAIKMPRFQSFSTPNDYYGVLFHELIHSTGNAKRLKRTFGRTKKSKEYAKEELVAEFGAVFLSAQAGIIWHTNESHATYLKGWNNVLKIAKDDNKFLMRGASDAQKASDFVLNLDAKNTPAFHKDLGKIVTTKKTVSIPDSSAYPVAIPETPKTNTPFDSCGRLRKGWKFQNGKPVQVTPKKKATKKSIVKKPTKTVVKPAVKEVEKPTKKKYDFNFNKLLSEKILHEYAILGYDTNVQSDRDIAKGYAYNQLASYIARNHLSFLKYKITNALNEAKKPELTKLFEKEIKKRGLTVNIDIDILSNISQKKAVKVVKPAVKENTKTLSKEELFSKEDIPYQLAYDAHRGTSFDPEKRAVSHQNEYYNTLKEIYEVNYKKAIELSKEDDFEAKFIRFKNGYLNRYLAYLRSKNGMMSTMITGASNFPVARMRKKSDAIDKKLNELVEFVDKYDNFFKAKAPEKIKTGSADAIDKLNKKLIGLEEQHALMKKGNAVINKVLRKKGLSRDAQIKEITIGFEDFFKQKVIEAWVKLNKDGSSIKSNSFYLTNLTANIREVKKQIVLEKRLKEDSNEKGNTEIEFENGTIIINRDINKFQILFDGKPDADVRAFLKKSGHAFKWSPTNGVWQRQLNTYYRGNIDDLYAFLGVEVKNISKKKAKIVEKPAVNTENLSKPKTSLGGSSLASKLANRQNKVAEFYKIQDKNISEFLGKIEVKEKESVVITLTGGQGSMKTRCAFRFINAFAQNYKVGHASIEEHPESTLYWNKVHEYISDKAMANISNPEIKSISDLDKLIQANDVIVIDSFAKLQEIERGFEVDKDLRKKYDGKIFIVIFQQTTDGKMRGGSKSQFDGDVILFTQKFDDYQENYIYADKNRYQNKNLSDLKYNIFEGVLKIE